LVPGTYQLGTVICQLSVEPRMMFSGEMLAEITATLDWPLAGKGWVGSEATGLVTTVPPTSSRNT
jgi:hypothetical protein